MLHERKPLKGEGGLLLTITIFCVALSIELLQKRISVRGMSLKYTIPYNNQNCLARKKRNSAGSEFFGFGDKLLIKMLHKYR